MFGMGLKAALILHHQNKIINSKKLKIMTTQTSFKGQALNNNSDNKQQCVINRSMLRMVAALLILAAAVPASAQVRLGLKGGVTVNEMRFDHNVAGGENRLGYTGGLVLDLEVPVAGLGVELGAMYSHRDSKLASGSQYYKRHYIDIPIHARYTLRAPGAGKILAPFAFTGPNSSVLFKEGEASNRDNSKTSVSWDLGAGVELFNHLRVSASYGLGLSKSIEVVDVNEPNGKISGKDNCWTLSATYLF